MDRNYLNLSHDEWTQHLLSVSITSWSKDDFEFMGYYSRKMLALNGDPFEPTCAGKYPNLDHKINLEGEDSIIYLVCTGCSHTEVLTNKVKNNVQAHRERENEWRL